MKIFGIGLSKTGTSSLARALEIIGYRTKDYMGIESYIRGDLASLDKNTLEKNDAFTDTPIPSFYKELDQKYPNSKFILTVRDEEGWLKSCKKQFTQKLADKQNEAQKKLFTDIYGCSVFDEEFFKSGYNKFVKSVLDYFENRAEDLLVLDIAAGDGWEKLCPFLDKPIPDIAFPKANVTQIRWMNVDDVIMIARLAGEGIINAYYAKHGKQANSATVKPKFSMSLAFILSRFRYTTCSHIIEKAAKEAARVIEERLKAITATIPVITPFGLSVPFPERCKWNHFWLVDPLENAEAFLKGEKDFTVNIALIEDNKPYMGVVYAPLVDTMYYGTVGKGAFCKEYKALPRQLRSKNTFGQRLSESRLVLSDTWEENPSKSKAISMCRIADGNAETINRIGTSKEWETAAAHAIIAAVGLKVKYCNMAEELRYNKETFTNDCIIIK